MSETDLFDIAIVGYGPTGATLASLVAQQDLSVLVIEREKDIYDLPRAVHFDDETMRVFQAAGIAEDLVEYLHINPGMRFVDDQDNLLLDWPRDPDITSQGWNASYRVHQPDLEKLLRAYLDSCSNVRIVKHCELTTATEVEGHVLLDCKERATGSLFQFKARYAVGCDGANSTLRKTIGGGLNDLGFRERWLVLDLLLNKPRPDLGDHSIQFCNPKRPMTYCRGPKNRRRWEITMLEGEQAEDIVQPEQVWKFLSRWITPDDATLERSAVYTFRSAVAHTWRKGRLLIAGDAAHLTPPFMGQGMCMGVRDAFNLAWKLAAVVQARADDALLDSYQVERAPHALAYVKTAIQLGGLINSMDRERALQFEQDQTRGQASMKSIRPKLGQSNFMLSQPENPDDPVGWPFAQPLLGSDDIRFDDFVGYHHVIITQRPPQQQIPSDIKCLDAASYPSLAKQLNHLKTGAVWVRPDRYIGAIAADADALLNKMQIL